MARLTGLSAMFNLRQIKDQLQERINNVEQKYIEALQYEGELFINKARSTGNYKDQTGNLRSSVGYIILKDGRTVKSAFPGAKQIGKSKAQEAAAEVASEYPKGLVLIGVAGMNYAAAVEAKGYDVITGSAPESSQIKDLLGAIKL